MKNRVIANLETIQKATAYHQETLTLSPLAPSGGYKLNVPVGARTALVIFDSDNADEGIIRYLEADESLDLETNGILADKGEVKELIGQEMFAFRARPATGDFQIIRVTYTR